MSYKRIAESLLNPITYIFFNAVIIWLKVKQQDEYIIQYHRWYEYLVEYRFHTKIVLLFNFLNICNEKYVIISRVSQLKISTL